MDRNGVDRFTEVVLKVSQTFKGTFSLSVDPIGSVMSGKEKPFDISPENANRFVGFMDSADNYGYFSPEAPRNFLIETEEGHAKPGEITHQQSKPFGRKPLSVKMRNFTENRSAPRIWGIPGFF
ncbi:MAG: hypothetical protein WA705_07930 [Candidatus Ozemobacteraceae bacterium]